MGVIFETVQRQIMEWQEDRWHCCGRAIHSGDRMEMLFPDGCWVPVRIIYGPGRSIRAYFDHHGMELGDAATDEKGYVVRQLRWPTT